MTFLKIKVKIKLRCNVYNDVTAEKKCCIWFKVEKYSLIIILNLMLFIERK